MEPINAAAIDVDTLEFDPDALREKYRVERDKRLRADGNEQYVRIEGALSHYVDDPHASERIERAPLTDEVNRSKLWICSVPLMPARNTYSLAVVWFDSTPPPGFHSAHGGCGTGVEPTQPFPNVAKFAKIRFEPVPPVTTSP